MHIAVCKRTLRVRAGVTVAAGAAGLAAAHAVLSAATPADRRPPACLPLCLQVVVATDTSLAESIRIDEFCHANGIAFIKVRRLLLVLSMLQLMPSLIPAADALHAAAMTPGTGGLQS